MNNICISLIYGRLLILTLGVIFFTACKTGKEPEPEEEVPVENYPEIEVQIDKERSFQTMDGFGFFGAKDVWWGAASNMWDTAWGDKVISDLGITIWRSEFYPPAIPTANQDGDWAKQQPVVAGLKAKADQYNVPLKFIASVWSPPAHLKWGSNFAWAGDAEATRWEDPNVTTKDGGTLNPNKYAEYADYLNQHIKQYKELGIDLHALSLQNEPAFSQYFNSCTYTTYWYNDLLINVVPKVKAANPDINIFGAEHMLAMEGKESNWRWFYHSAIKASSAAAANVDILAVHGYSDGVLPSSGSELVQMWQNHTEQFAIPMNKKVWMSETSGYSENWETVTGRTGALGLGLDMMAALNYGQINAWVWWQGSELNGIGNSNLMSGTSTGTKYHVSKHFFRYIRPGAVRIGTESADENIFVTAFKHPEKGTTTVVIINAGEPKTIRLRGDGLPTEFDMYRSNYANAEYCTLISKVTANGQGFVLPGKSIVTLQAGGDAL